MYLSFWLMHFSGSNQDSAFFLFSSLSLKIFPPCVFFEQRFLMYWILFLFSPIRSEYIICTCIYLLNSSKCKTQHSSAAVSFGMPLHFLFHVLFRSDLFFFVVLANSVVLANVASRLFFGF